MSRESVFSSTNPADIAWRRQQMSICNDIEGVARDPALDALVESWDAAGVPLDEQIERLKAFFKGR